MKAGHQEQKYKDIAKKHKFKVVQLNLLLIAAAGVETAGVDDKELFQKLQPSFMERTRADCSDRNVPLVILLTEMLGDRSQCLRRHAFQTLVKPISSYIFHISSLAHNGLNDVAGNTVFWKQNDAVTVSHKQQCGCRYSSQQK